jgi:hypothetical protein
MPGGKASKRARRDPIVDRSIKDHEILPVQELRFTAKGLLAPGEHDVTIDQLRSGILVTGPTPRGSGWDADHRSLLVDRLEAWLPKIWLSGARFVVVDGSFVEEKGRPSDLDAYFVYSTRSALLHGVQFLRTNAPPGYFDKRTSDEAGHDLMRREQLLDFFWCCDEEPPKKRSDVRTYFASTRSGDPKGVIRIVKESAQ